MEFKIIYQDNNVLVIDKPAGIVVFHGIIAGPDPAIISENIGVSDTPTLIELLLSQKPELKNVGEAPRYGIVHRLDKNTSGILLIAKTPKSLIFLQKQFSAGAKALADKKNRESLDKTLEKRYIALATGVIKEDAGIIHTLIGRSKSDPRKQKATWLKDAKPEGKREAISEYKVIGRFENYTLLELQIKTGRKHQIRTHLAYIHHPIAGDKMYGFKDSPKPEGLERQFLHASYLKIQLLDGQMREFTSELPEDLKKILTNLK